MITHDPLRVWSFHRIHSIFKKVLQVNAKLSYHFFHLSFLSSSFLSPLFGSIIPCIFHVVLTFESPRQFYATKLEVL